MSFPVSYSYSNEIVRFFLIIFFALEKESLIMFASFFKLL